MYVWGYVHTNAGALGGQRHRISLEVESQAVVSHSMWMLGTEL